MNAIILKNKMALIQSMKLIKKIAVMVALLLIAGNALAADYRVKLHAIDATIDDEGFASIKERFYLDFFNSPDFLETFRKKSSELGTNLSDWQAFDSRFKVSVGSLEEIRPGSGSIAFVENTESYLELTYLLSEPIMKKNAETSRSIEFELKRTSLKEFTRPPFYIIPEGTVMTFVLPAQTTVSKEDVSPEAEISVRQDGSFVTWTGLKTSTDLKLKYFYWKQIAPRLSLGVALKEFVEGNNRFFQALILLIIALAIAAVYFYKKPIEKKVTEFIIKNSDFTVEEE